ncbi:MAG: hypothetical protein ACYS1A_15635 [Planctomycetota bacterium]
MKLERSTVREGDEDSIVQRVWVAVRFQRGCYRAISELARRYNFLMGGTY